MGQDAGVSVTVRPAEPDDVPALVRFVHELAEYEREPDACRLTVDHLHEALFGDTPAVFGTVALHGDDLAGAAIWFLTYSTWTGVHGIHLEDLYVSPAHRRHGVARELLAELARTCLRRGYARLEWAVLDWNTPALDFYATLGSGPMDGWTTHRLNDEALATLAGVR
jgi:GNAT superfamily N-acetyltransferase